MCSANCVALVDLKIGRTLALMPTPVLVSSLRAPPVQSVSGTPSRGPALVQSGVAPFVFCFNFHCGVLSQRLGGRAGELTCPQNLPVKQEIPPFYR